MASILPDELADDVEHFISVAEEKEVVSMDLLQFKPGHPFLRQGSLMAGHTDWHQRILRAIYHDNIQAIPERLRNACFRRRGKADISTEKSRLLIVKDEATPSTSGDGQEPWPFEFGSDAPLGVPHHVIEILG